MALKVFGTGHGRTGTMSLKLALEQLGFGKCYHMYELLNNPDQIIYFEKAERGEKVDWDELFKGYHSACDMPVIRYYEQILAMYPDAKVIHTTRDADSWFKSITQTIFWATKPSFGMILSMIVRMPFSSQLRKRLRVFKYNSKMLDTLFGKELKDKEKIIKCFNEHNEKVLNSISKEKLLVYDVKSGWEPLCKFLNVPVPVTPFPRVNSKDEFVNNVKTKMLKKRLDE